MHHENCLSDLIPEKQTGAELAELLKKNVSEGEAIYWLCGKVQSPEFEKTKGYYEVNVENEVERITVGATAEINTTSIRGIGEYALSV